MNRWIWPTLFVGTLIGAFYLSRSDTPKTEPSAEVPKAKALKRERVRTPPPGPKRRRARPSGTGMPLESAGSPPNRAYQQPPPSRPTQPARPQRPAQIQPGTGAVPPPSNGDPYFGEPNEVIPEDYAQPPQGLAPGQGGDPSGFQGGAPIETFPPEGTFGEGFPNEEALPPPDDVPMNPDGGLPGPNDVYPIEPPPPPDPLNEEDL